MRYIGEINSKKKELKYYNYMKLFFQKNSNLRDILGLNNGKCRIASSGKKKKKYYVNNRHKIPYISSSASYSNYSKTNTLFLMFIIYVIFGIVFYNLLHW